MKDHRWFPEKYIGQEGSGHRLVQCSCLDCGQRAYPRVGYIDVDTRNDALLRPCDQAAIEAVMLT